MNKKLIYFHLIIFQHHSTSNWLNSFNNSSRVHRDSFNRLDLSSISCSWYRDSTTLSRFFIIFLPSIIFHFLGFTLNNFLTQNWICIQIVNCNLVYLKRAQYRSFHTSQFYQSYSIVSARYHFFSICWSIQLLRIVISHQNNTSYFHYSLKLFGW